MVQRKYHQEIVCVVFFVFKQETAYEMRISDWSSDVCSSDLAASFDWSRVLHTSDPEYYRWNQWLFLKLYERGLAYRKESPVNWCPFDQTVLANEQVVDGHCERFGNEVVKKKLTQWYLKITDYADRLLDDLNQLEDRQSTLLN